MISWRDRRNTRSQKIAFSFSAVFLFGVILYSGSVLVRYAAFSWGMDNYQSKNYERASSYLRVAATLGNTRAMTVLGTMFVLAKGVDKDSTKAIYWLERAAIAEDVDAQSFLGIMYVTGVGVPLNLDKGIPLLEKAAFAGDNEARKLLESIRRR